MRKFLFAVIVIMFSYAHIVFAQSLGGPTFAQSVFGLPFGGQIISQLPCAIPPGLFITIKSQFGVTPLYWPAGNLRYASYIPPHMGQNILGMAAKTPVACVTGLGGAGFPILFHGSSKL